jgi:hypothetical protein
MQNYDEKMADIHHNSIAVETEMLAKYIAMVGSLLF